MKKIKMDSQVTKILIVLLFIPAMGFGQNTSSKTTSLEEVITIALENNLSVKLARQEIEWNKQMAKTSTDIGKTDFTWQHGQYNSFFKNDNAFTVSQSIAFPTVYLNNSNVANAATKSSELQLSVIENDLIAKVKSHYYNAVYAQANLSIIERLDSIYVNYAKAADSKFQAGETSFLQKTSAESQMMEVHNRLNMAKSEARIQLSRLRSLINANEEITISKDINSNRRVFLVEIDTAGINSNNPVLVLLQQQIQEQSQRESLQRSMLLPDITVGYFNQSQIGSQTVNGINYNFTASDRFTGFQVGLAIPIWVKPQLAKVQAAKIQTEIAETNYEISKSNLDGIYVQAVQEYLKYKNNLEYYESSGLTQSELILENAQQELKNGSIGYFEYIQSVNQSIAIQLSWLESLNKFNQALIQLEYLAGIK